jgi:hypothetical protein
MLRVALILLLLAASATASAQFRAPAARRNPAQPARPRHQPRSPAALAGISRATAGPATAARGPQLVDRIVAIVNKEVITQRDLAERTKLIESQLKRQGTPLPPADVLERQVLERMISDRVQIQYARETGVRADDLQVDRTVQMIAEQNKMSLTDFRAVLDRQGVSFQKFRDDIRNEILISRLREREVDSKIQVAESDIDNFLRTRRRRRRGRCSSTSRTSWCASPRTRAPSRSRRAADAPRMRSPRRAAARTSASSR